jgi:hypothetical protein
MKSLVIDPRRWKTHCDLGRSLSVNGDMAGAEAELRAAVALNPKSTDTHMHFREVLAAKDDAVRPRPSTRMPLSSTRSAP